IRAIEIEEYYKHTPFSGRQVPKIDSLIIGVNIDRDERRKKITDRLKQRLANGMLDEIKSLLDTGIPPENLIYYGLEYKFVTEYLIGKTTYQDMFDKLEIAIHQFSKRQMTWFRGMERRGFEIHWIDAMHPIEENIKEIKDLWQ
ncbi:MAG: tRNA (adenosine(37)-N6)-dimethylallyltransferase MiaA, partial [Prevotella sp.]|nr:tRNA (adenosine(37)-N6)-dimethylallyltransferase MiaA [Prevotella sp.]